MGNKLCGLFFCELESCRKLVASSRMLIKWRSPDAAGGFIGPNVSALRYSPTFIFRERTEWCSSIDSVS